MNSRELVYKTLNFDKPERAPRQLWELPWAENNHPVELNKIRRDFRSDIVWIPWFSKNPPKTTGEQFGIGEYVDEWGCRFLNKQRGIQGEAKESLITGEDWEDRNNLVLPVGYLDLDHDRIKKYCKDAEKFVIFGCPNPFERLQYIRGTEQLYVDLMLKPEGMFEVIRKVHDFNCSLFEAWAKTDVDALQFMDDWGSQTTLLINPKIWEEIFKPMYKDYIEIAHSHGKKMFMHSDGNILSIIPQLIELGVDALNSQVFCMGVENLKQFKGKITFWGEIDRQNILPYGTQKEIEDAVISVKNSLWQDGGCIAQCEFGPGAKPENVYKVFETWNKII
ncbi:MAG TPA: uroporphyrinogen decarboxylase family protein [Ruminiclostridium sp.]